MVGLNRILKKDLVIDYRRVYTGNAVLELHDKTTVEKKIEIAIEHSPLGHIDINVSLIDGIDYPLVPTLRAIKTYILDMQKKGQFT